MNLFLNINYTLPPGAAQPDSAAAHADDYSTAAAHTTARFSAEHSHASPGGAAAGRGGRGILASPTQTDSPSSYPRFTSQRYAGEEAASAASELASLRSSLEADVAFTRAVVMAAAGAAAAGAAAASAAASTGSSAVSSTMSRVGDFAYGLRSPLTPRSAHQRQMRLLATLAESTSPRAEHDRDDGGSSSVSTVSMRTADLLARSFALLDAGMSPSSKTGYSTP
eukprot:gene23130-30333_t